MSYEAVIFIFGVPVYARALPSGDLAIWHPFNDTVRGVVEPICRRHGYWRAEYNNWVVESEYKRWVLNELRDAGYHRA
jgi:hypothetical protein